MAIKNQIKNWELDKTDGWYIVLDNGGGLTLCVVDKYQHNYDDAKQLATDIMAMEQDGIDSVSEWGGNQLCLCGTKDFDDCGTCNTCDGYELLDPSNEDIRNGGYRIIESIGQLLSTNDEDMWGHNGRDLKKSLLEEISK